MTMPDQNQLIAAALAVIAAIVIIRYVLAVFRKQQANPQLQTVRCSCGWSGRVSRLAGRCPKCNQSLGQQKINRPDA